MTAARVERKDAGLVAHTTPLQEAQVRVGCDAVTDCPNSMVAVASSSGSHAVAPSSV